MVVAAVVVVVAPAAVDVVEPPAGTVVGTVVGAVLGTPLTLGRVPTATRIATAAMKRARTTAARTTVSEPDMPVGGSSSSMRCPACPAPAPEASLCAGEARNRVRAL